MLDLDVADPAGQLTPGGQAIARKIEAGAALLALELARRPRAWRTASPTIRTMLGGWVRAFRAVGRTLPRRLADRARPAGRRVTARASSRGSPARPEPDDLASRGAR
jgi:hypothetical protein